MFGYSFPQEDQKKIEEEKEKKKENYMVFKAWLQKKREQVLEMRRIQRAKQIEDMNSRVSSSSSWRISSYIYESWIYLQKGVWLSD